MLTVPPGPRKTPEVRLVFQNNLLVLQHSPLGWRFSKRTPGVGAAIVDVELEALATVENASKLTADLAGDLEETWWARFVCVGSEGVWEMMFIDDVAQFRGEAQ